MLTTTDRVLSEYELEREANIGRNSAFLASLGLCSAAKVDRVAATPAAPGQKEIEQSVFRDSADRRRRVRSSCTSTIRAELCSSYPGRSREIDLLLKLVPGDVDLAVAGPSACGKTAVTRAVLEALEEPFAWISCATLEKKGVAACVFQRAAADLCSRHGYNAEIKRNFDATGFSRFVEEFGRETMIEHISIVLDDAHYLFRSTDGLFGGQENAAACLGWAKNLCCEVRIRFVLVGDDRGLSTTNLATNDLAMMCEPVRIDVEAYDSNAFAEVLVAVAKRRKIPRAEDTLFGLFAKQIVAVGRRSCPEPSHLVKLCASAKLFELYAGSGDEGETTLKKYERIKPILKIALDNLHDPYLDVDALCDERQQTSSSKSSARRDGEAARQKFLGELPQTAKLALLAAFVSSYLHKDADTALFTSDARTSRRKAQRKSHKRRRRQDDDDEGPEGGGSGPQPVPLDRLLSFHAYFLAEHSGRKTPVRDPNTLLHLAQLSSLNLLDRSNNFDDLSQLKYRCLLQPDQAYQLAHTLRFPLANYLPALTSY